MFFCHSLKIFNDKFHAFKNVYIQHRSSLQNSELHLTRESAASNFPLSQSPTVRARSVNCEKAGNSPGESETPAQGELRRNAARARGIRDYTTSRVYGFLE